MRKKSIILLTIFCIMALMPTFSFARNIDGFSFSTVTANDYTSTGYITKTSSHSVPAVINLTTGSPNDGYVQHGHNVDCMLRHGFYDDSGHGIYWEEITVGLATVSPNSRTTINYSGNYLPDAGEKVDLSVSVVTSSDPNYYHQVSGSWSPDAY